MESINIANLLQAAGSHDINLRGPAEQQLKQLENHDLAQYMGKLAQELNDEQKQAPMRQLAGILLKNTIYSNHPATQLQLSQRWCAIPDNIRNAIRDLATQSLGSPTKPVRQAGASIVAAIAAIDIPRNAWPNLLPAIVNNITTAASTTALKESSFNALGYICEKVGQHLQQHSNQVLNAIAVGMNAEQQDVVLTLAATQCLANSLHFAKSNMENENERSLIMQMVATSTKSTSVDVRVAAYQCLSEIASEYYPVLTAYIEDLFTLTAQAISKEQDEVAQQAIEFWSTICDSEIDIQEDELEAQETGEPVKRTCQHYAKRALPQMIPLLLEALTKQAEEVEDDTWSSAMAAGSCLILMAQNTRDDIVAHVLPFVQQNFGNESWRFRDAAILAFGTILDGPSKDILRPIVTSALRSILERMADASPQVKDTAAWAIGKICDLLPDCVESPVLPFLMESLVKGLSDHPKIAANVCWAIRNLADVIDVPDGETTSPLSPYFEGLVKALLQTAQRNDADDANLLASCYETINMLCHTAAPDMYALINQLVPELQSRLGATLTQSGLSQAEHDVQGRVQALLCGALQVIIQKLHDTDVVPMADASMTLFLQVLQSKHVTVHEEAYMAIGAVANRVGANFTRYMTDLSPLMLQGLRNSAEYTVCARAVGMVGDIARALGRDLMPHCDGMMEALLEIPNNPDPTITRVLKPHVIACFGDIAFAVGGFFERYISFVMQMLTQSSALHVDPADYENREHLDHLRESILETYTSILCAFGADNKAAMFIPFLADPAINLNVLGFLAALGKDDDLPDGVLRSAVGVVGDLASQLGPLNSPQAPIATVLQDPSIQTLLARGANSRSDRTKKAALWARDRVQLLVSGAMGSTGMR